MSALVHEFEAIRPDPPHLPRAPILRHNVSLCHGCATPLFSPTATPAASSDAHAHTRTRRAIARTRNPRFWKLAATRIAQLNTGRASRPPPGEETHTPGGWRDGFSACIHLPPPAPGSPHRPRFSPFSDSTSVSTMQPRMSRKNIIAFVSPATLYPRVSAAGPPGNMTARR